MPIRVPGRRHGLVYQDDIASISEALSQLHWDFHRCDHPSADASDEWRSDGGHRQQFFSDEVTSPCDVP